MANPRLYPRTISIAKNPPKTGEGALPYGGRTTAALVTFRTGVRCSIQARREGNKSAVGLPADGPMGTWYVFTPRGVLADGEVKNSMIFTDDLGRRFQVIQDYTNVLGGRFSVQKLEA